MKHTPLSLPMTRTEQFWGLGFLLVQQLMLSRLVWLLPLNSPATTNFLYAAISFVAVSCVFFRFWKESLKNFPKKIGIFLWRILLSYAGCTVITELFGQLLYPAFPDYFSITQTGPVLKTPNDHFLTSLLGENLALAALCAVVLLPPVEEIIHRGVIFGSLYAKSPITAYLVSAVLFSAIHVVDHLGNTDPLWLLLSFLGYLPAGLLLARLYKETGSIFAPIFMHMAINAVALLDLR